MLTMLDDESTFAPDEKMREDMEKKEMSTS